MSKAWDYPAPYTLEISATGDDVDGLGHVNNAAYIRWCESLAWRHSGELGLSVEDYVAMQRAMAIHHAEYDYLQACFAGDQLQAGTWITACDFKLSMERRFQLIHRLSGETVFRGAWQLVCVNLESNKPVRIPGRFIDAYRGAVVSKQ
jgi:acyl-CoA thioester hydrolase